MAGLWDDAEEAVHDSGGDGGNDRHHQNLLFSQWSLLLFKRKPVEDPKKGPEKEKETTLLQGGCLFIFIKSMLKTSVM